MTVLRKCICGSELLEENESMIRCSKCGAKVELNCVIYPPGELGKMWNRAMELPLDSAAGRG